MANPLYKDEPSIRILERSNAATESFRLCGHSREPPRKSIHKKPGHSELRWLTQLQGFCILNSLYGKIFMYIWIISSDSELVADIGRLRRGNERLRTGALDAF